MQRRPSVSAAAAEKPAATTIANRQQLEGEAKRALNLPRIICIADYTETGTGPGAIRVTEIRPVQDIEELPADVEAFPFADRKPLVHSEVQFEISRAPG